MGLDPTNRWLLVPDLGIDRVVVYQYVAAADEWKRAGEGVCPPGSGPRHLRFASDGNSVFVMNELRPSVTVFAWDADTGELTALKTVPSLPSDRRSVPSYGSELQVHPTGRFVYAANRGDDSISVFRWDAQDRELTLVACERANVQWPRHFSLDPSGQWLLVAGERSDSISVFGVDPKSGLLHDTGQITACPQPMCILFSAAESS